MTGLPGPFPVILSAGPGPLPGAFSALAGPLPIESAAGPGPLGVISTAGPGPLPADGAGVPPPTYQVDFTVTGALPSFISFARAAGPATYFDSSGNLQVAGTNVPRFTYDPTMLTPMGFLSEGAATNFVRNNTMVGASTGILPVPGVVPTNWSVTTNANGLVATIIAVGTTNNVNTIDIRFSGTTVSTGACQIFFETTSGIAAANAQIYQNSAFLGIVGGDNSNLTNMSLDLAMYNSGSTFLASIAGLNIYSNIPTGPIYRFRNRQIVNQTTTAFVAPVFTITPATLSAVDITIRIGMPQADRGAFYTSVIPTSGSTAARVADGAQLTAPVSTLLATTTYSVAMQTNQVQNSSSGAAVGSFGQEYLGLGFTPGTDLQVTHARTSSTFRINNLLTDNLSTLLPLSIGVSNNGGGSTRYLTNNGGTQVGGTVASDATPIAIGPWFGTSQSKGFPLDGTIKSFKAWNTALTSAQLETVTLPPTTTCWGDSLTAGTGSVYITAGWGFPGFLSSALGQQTVVPFGFPGQGSSFIADQMVANPYHTNDNIVIWTGRNNIDNINNTIVTNTQRMIAHLAPGNTRYVVLSVTNDTSEGTGTDNYNKIIAANAAIAAAFPNNYLDVRSAIVAASGGVNDAPANSWMYQAGIHFIDPAYVLIAQMIKTFGAANGWIGYV